ncbi:unnamed protein product [Blepharisma stoltei]|uniref:Uncharacterized protein n=1 Tax=Blepharisma stoltei TaxID=1481888 RepID=A0AAU9J2N4_9CILI|nr:unnamed protein product [Blepharisma stoltei]
MSLNVKELQQKSRKKHKVLGFRHLLMKKKPWRIRYISDSLPKSWIRALACYIKMALMIWNVYLNKWGQKCRWIMKFWLSLGFISQATDIGFWHDLKRTAKSRFRTWTIKTP